MKALTIVTLYCTLFRIVKNIVSIIPQINIWFAIQADGNQVDASIKDQLVW